PPRCPGPTASSPRRAISGWWWAAGRRSGSIAPSRTGSPHSTRRGVEAGRALVLHRSIAALNLLSSVHRRDRLPQWQPAGPPFREIAMTEVVIASAARTPIGSFSGALASLPASELGKTAIVGALERAKVAPEQVDEVVLGQILTAGAGQNPARQAAVAAGVPYERTAYQINQLCGSGLRAVALGYQAIRNGDSAIVVAGGQESMSQAPHCMHLRNGTRMGDAQMIDTMIRDGLWDAFNGYHMGCTAENVARQWQIGREEQDAWAARSQQ